MATKIIKVVLKTGLVVAGMVDAVWVSRTWRDVIDVCVTGVDEDTKFMYKSGVDALTVLVVGCLVKMYAKLIDKIFG